jgi:hypothetical protein
MAQNVAQPIFRQNYCITFNVVKSSRKIFATFVTLINVPIVNDQQTGENSPNLVTLVLRAMPK